MINKHDGKGYENVDISYIEASNIFDVSLKIPLVDIYALAHINQVQ